jgi:hypothetical protein
MSGDKSINEFLVTASPFMEVVEDTEKEIAQAKASEAEEDSDEEEEEELDEEATDDEEGEEEDSEEADEEEEDDDDEDEEEEEEEPEEKPKSKLYTATLPDGSQVKLTDNATVKIKVNGKFQRVAVGDLTSAYNGNIKHDELIRRSAEKTKELETRLSIEKAESEKARELTKAFLSGVTKGDLIEAMAVVAEMTGEGDANKVLNDALLGIGKAIDELAGMTPAEIEKRSKAHKLEAEYKKKERRLQEMDNKEAIAQAKAEKEALKEQLGLEEEEMLRAYNALNERNLAIQKEGKTPPKFTMNDIATLAVEYRHYNALSEVAKKSELELSGDDVNNLIEMAKIRARKERRWLTKKEYVQILSGYANKEIESVDRKVSTKPKTTPKSKEKKKTAVKTISRLSELWD